MMDVLEAIQSIHVPVDEGAKSMVVMLAFALEGRVAVSEGPLT